MLPVLLILIFLYKETASRSIQCDPDAFLNTEQLIEARGYKAEKHFVTTKDEYILTLHRIVNPIFALHTSLKPVFLQHGLTASSIEFINNSEERGLIYNKWYNSSKLIFGNNLGFVLADLGYDVWIGNSRGISYSLNHTFLNPETDNAYWAFSFDELVKYDLPASIEYVLATTNQSTLAYIGHSQGSAMMFALLATQLQYSSKIKPFIAMSPVVVTRNFPFILKAGSPFRFIMLKPKRVLKLKPLKPHDIRCSSVVSYFLLKLNTLYSGNDCDINSSRAPVYVAAIPESTSSWTVLQYSQWVSSGNFTFFDYGPELNKIHYSSSQAPEYPIGNITSPNIIIYSAREDRLSNPESVQALKSRLKVRLLREYEVTRPTFSHQSFLWAKDVGQLVNREIVLDLQRYG